MMKRKLFSLLLILALTLGMAAPALAETLYGVCTTPTSDGAAYVRRTAGEGRPIVGSARNGDELIILQKGNTWHKVQVVRTGVSGWMYGAYITFTQSTSEIDQPGKVSSGAGYANFRRGPATSAALICRLDNGAALHVLRKTGTWYYVYCAGQNAYGYVASGLVALVSSVPEYTDDRRTAMVASSDGFANLRRGPGTDYGIVITLNNGTQVEVFEAEGHWTRVNVPSSHHYGYVYTDLLSFSAGASGIVYKTGSIDSSDGYANFRSGPGTDHPVQAKLYNSVLVTILAEEGDWLKVQLSDGSQTGYVYAKLVSVLKTEGTKTTTSDVNLRCGPGVEYAKVTTVTAGTVVSVLSVSGNFARVNADGLIGWVSVNYLK